MKGLHEIDATADDRINLRPFADWYRDYYANERATGWLRGYRDVVRVPLATHDWIWTDPLRTPTFETVEVDTRAVLLRLDGYIDRLRWQGVTLEDIGLRVSRVEIRALNFVRPNEFAEGAPLSYRGVRLFVDG